MPVSFDVTIPEVERDVDLPDKLKAEWSASCGGWLMAASRGSTTALILAAMRDVTAAYLQADDAVCHRDRRMLHPDPNVRRSSSALFWSLTEWVNAQERWSEAWKLSARTRKSTPSNAITHESERACSGFAATGRQIETMTDATLTCFSDAQHVRAHVMCVIRRKSGYPSHPAQPVCRPHPRADQTRLTVNRGATTTSKGAQFCTVGSDIELQV
jgi:hypothetical protein